MSAPVNPFLGVAHNNVTLTTSAPHLAPGEFEINGHHCPGGQLGPNVHRYRYVTQDRTAYDAAARRAKRAHGNTPAAANVLFDALKPQGSMPTGRYRYPLLACGQMEQVTKTWETLKRELAHAGAFGITLDDRAVYFDAQSPEEARRIGKLIEDKLWAPKGTITLTKEEVEKVRDALAAGQRDIWQTARVSESNLTGIDPTHPNDPPVKPETPRLIHRQGIDESMQVHRQLGEALGLVYKALESKPGWPVRPSTTRGRAETQVWSRSRPPSPARPPSPRPRSSPTSTCGTRIIATATACSSPSFAPVACPTSK